MGLALKTKDKTEFDRPNIFTYHDYRHYLRDWFGYLKKSRRGFSVRQLAREAKLSSGYLSMVLAGSRKLSAKAMAKMFPKIGLNFQERTYLEQLCKVADSDTQEVRLDALERLQKYRSYKTLNPKEIEVYRYLTRWFYVAIREMVSLPDFELDAEWIHGRLRGKISLNEVKQGLEFLISHGYIKPLPDGKASLPDKDIECVGGVYKLALGQFHSEMLQMARDSITEVPSDQRHITGHVMALSPEQFEKVKAILEKTLKQVASLEKTGKQSNSVYHVGLLGFPLTKV